ncbi:MAG TPA: DUF1236 domain-containing protein [Chthonomonadaceae bacterium]|nr:DUF1236 domain-containing protein [Chthonomonadaceae bacterium]
MRKPLLSIVAASALLASAGLAAAQTTTTTTTTQTWNADQGNTIRQYTTTKHYQTFTEPAPPQVGAEVPSNVTLYPLPPDVRVSNPDEYSYTVINNQPMVVERTTRRVVHTWGP